MQNRSRSTRNTFAGILGRARATQNLTFRELANRTGLSDAYLCRIEQGGRIPNDDAIRAIAQAIGADEDVLLRQAAIERVRRLEARVEVARRAVR